MKSPMKPKRIYQQLYVVVFAAMLLGIAFGFSWPALAVQMKPLGDAFINLVKMLIGPIIFCTVVHGIASMGDLKKLGRIGGKTLIYFEVVSTLALIIGLVVVNILKPGVGFNIDAPEGGSGNASGFCRRLFSRRTVAQSGFTPSRWEKRWRWSDLCASSNPFSLTERSS